jgi:hypothetical protein
LKQLLNPGQPGIDFGPYFVAATGLIHKLLVFYVVVSLFLVKVKIFRPFECVVPYISSQRILDVDEKACNILQKLLVWNEASFGIPNARHWVFS